MKAVMPVIASDNDRAVIIISIESIIRKGRIYPINNALNPKDFAITTSTLSPIFTSKDFIASISFCSCPETSHMPEAWHPEQAGCAIMLTIRLFSLIDFTIPVCSIVSVLCILIIYPVTVQQKYNLLDDFLCL